MKLSTVGRLSRRFAAALTARATPQLHRRAQTRGGLRRIPGEQSTVDLDGRRSALEPPVAGPHRLGPAGERPEIPRKLEGVGLAREEVDDAGRIRRIRRLDARVAPAACRQDVRPACRGQQARDVGVVARRHPGVPPDPVDEPRRGGARPRRRPLDLLFDLARAPFGGGAAPAHGAQLAPEPGDVFRGARVGEQDWHLGTKRLDPRPRVLLAVREHDVRREGDHASHIGVLGSAHGLDLARLGRPHAVVRAADDERSGPEVEDRLGEAGHEGDDTTGRPPEGWSEPARGRRDLHAGEVFAHALAGLRRAAPSPSSIAPRPTRPRRGSRRRSRTRERSTRRRG